MRLLRVTATLAALAPATASPQGFDGALDVSLSVAPTGATLSAVQPFRVHVNLKDPDTGHPVEDAHLSGWIRPAGDGNASCSEAARSYFVNQGALPRGETDLSRSLYGVLHDDGHLSVVDWEHALATANIRAMVPVPAGGAGVQDLPGRFAFGIIADGQAWQVPAMEGAEPARLFPGIRAITPNGWLHRNATLEAPDGQSWPLPRPPAVLRATLPDPDDGRDRAVIALTGDHATLYQPGEAPLRLAAPKDARDVAYSGPAQAELFADGGARLWFSYPGNPPFDTPLAAPAGRVSVDPEGRIAIAWSPASSAVSVIDIATAAVVQAVELNSAPMDQTVREVGFAGTAAFLLLDRLDFVMVISLDRARRGEPAAMRAVRIGPAVTDLPPNVGPFLVTSCRGHDAGAVLVLHPDLSTAFPVSLDSGNSNAPMNGFRIRGARPLALAELNDALDEWT